ncbi:MAG: hypothetical protein WCT22_01560 [Patescibacteria group bacterium]|jgi:hypothetical protein
MSELRKRHTASEDEIRAIIEGIASASTTGYFYDSQVRRELERQGIDLRSSNFQAICGSMFYEDRLGPKIGGESRFPRSVKDRVKPMPEAPLMAGAPNLGLPNALKIVDGTYRHGAKGSRTGGIGHAKPRDLRPK